MKRGRTYPVAMAVIDGELWMRVGTGDPERATSVRPDILAAIADLGPGWHTGTLDRKTRLEKLKWRLGLRSDPDEA
jgi:hypothetical protein